MSDHAELIARARELTQDAEKGSPADRVVLIGRLAAALVAADTELVKTLAVIAEVRTVCEAVPVEGDWDTWGAYHEGRFNFASRVLSLLGGGSGE